MSSFFSFLRPAAGASSSAIGLDQIKQARERIAPHLPVTPLTLSHGLSELCAREVYLKWENMQRTGSFKERGALNCLLSLDDKARRSGVCAASAGNHALALSYHARTLGVPCLIVMPRTAPLVKIESTQRNQATVVLHGTNFDEAQEHCLELARQRSMQFVSAFADARVIAGQGTVALEICEQLEQFDGVVVCLGGGGLLSGIATALRALKPSVWIAGAQSQWALDGRKGLHQKALIAPSTIADGIGVKSPGKITEPIINRLVDQVVAASEAEIAKAVVLYLELEHSVVEGAGAAALAVLLKTSLPEHVRRVVLTVSGSNIDINLLGRLIERDMNARGRLLRIVISVPDRPGSLHAASGVLANCGANVLEVLHDRTASQIPGYVDMNFLLEVKSTEHKQQSLEALRQNGITVREV